MSKLMALLKQRNVTGIIPQVRPVGNKMYNTYCAGSSDCYCFCQDGVCYCVCN